MGSNSPDLRGALTVRGRRQAVEDATGGAVLPEVCCVPTVHQPLLQERRSPVRREAAGRHVPPPGIRYRAAPV